MTTSPPWKRVPVQWLSDDILSTFGISVGIKRLDLSHPVYGGNKLLKLWGLFELDLEELRQKGIVSMGGPHSNHAFSLAGLCKELNIPLRILVRGYPGSASSYILRQLQSWGIILERIDHENFRSWREDGRNMCEFTYPGALWIPEGGSRPGTNAAFGRVVREIAEDGFLASDPIIIPTGTGGTLSGLLPWLPPGQKIIGVNCVPGFPVLDQVANLAGPISEKHVTIWETNDFGRFGKTSETLIRFAYDWQSRHGIPLDPIYTARLFSELWERISRGEFETGNRLLVLHTGGMAGAISWEEKNGKNFIPPGIHPYTGLSGQM